MHRKGGAIPSLASLLLFQNSNPSRKSGIDGGDGQSGLLQNIQQSLDRIQRSEHGHIILGGDLTQLGTVILTVGAGILGVDEVGNVTLTQRAGNFIAALADLANRVRTNAVLLEELGSTLGCLDVKAEVVEAADKGQCLGLVLICNGDQHRAVILKVSAACLQP